MAETSVARSANRARAEDDQESQEPRYRVSLSFEAFSVAVGWETEDRMLRLVGLDAVTYLQFLRLLRWLFTAITVVVAVPLILSNYFLNTTSSYGIHPASFANVTATIGGIKSTAVVGDLQIISAGNIKGNGLYVHIMFELIVTLLVIVFGELASLARGAGAEGSDKSCGAS